MNNLLCCILFYLTSLSLVNADCSKHPDVINAVVNQTDQCRDITIRCNQGFTMEQVTECIDGEWKYQEPFCKPPECGYKFTNRTVIYITSIGNFRLNETECDKRCNGNIECSVALLLKSGECYHYYTPIISITLDTDLDQCIAKCTQMEDCIMLHHQGGEYQRCYLFNVTQNNLPGDKYFVTSTGNDYTLAEKFCL